MPDFPAKNEQTAENAEVGQRFSRLFPCDLSATSETSAVKKISALDPFLQP
jgi:hypothetical protein